MSKNIEAISVLKNAEQSFVDLVQKALAEHDYPQATLLMNLAGEMRDIAAGINDVLELEARQNAQGNVSDNAVRPSMEGVAEKQKRPRQAPKKGEFPKFLRDENNLYKLGWSKAEKSTYEHKAPKEVLLALLTKLKSVGVKKRRFTMEEILPLIRPENHAELPGYQVYLCVAWLRKLDLLVQHGRRGYSVPHPAKLEVSAEKAWLRLPNIDAAQK